MSSIKNYSHKDVLNCTVEIREYFTDQLELDNLTNLDLSIIENLLRIHEYLTLQQLTVLLCNLEDTELIQELIDGETDNFDPFDSSLFNDCYDSMMEDLGLNDDEDDDY